MNTMLKNSAIAAVILVIIGIPSLILEFIKDSQGLNEKFMSLSIILLLILLIAYILFARGLDVLGKKLNENKLRFVSYGFIILAILYYGYLIFTMLIPDAEIDFSMVEAVIAILFGILHILLGVSVMNMEGRFGFIAKLAGIAAIVCGAGLASIKLTTAALFLIFLLYAMLSSILSKAADTLK